MGFSGGKDSVVLYDLAIKSGVKFEAYYSATGIDPPELVRFIRENYPDLKWKRPQRSFYVDIARKGFPTKFSRWCCDTLKKNPTKDIPLKHRLMGIRKEESYKRRQRPIIDNLNRWKVYKPLFDWLEWEVWDYIKRYDLPYCSLYNEGFDRLGCVVCPFLCRPNQITLNKHKARWPKHYKAFERAMLRLYDNREWLRQRIQGRAMLFEEFLDNWYRGK